MRNHGRHGGFFAAAVAMLAVWICTGTVAAAAENGVGTLLAFDFEKPSAWMGSSTAGVGTIDALGGKEGSAGLRAVVEKGKVAGTAWTMAVSSGPLPLKNAETNLGKLTWSFSLSASAARPVRVKVQSFGADKKPTGAREGVVYPAAPDFYQRYAMELSTMKAVPGEAFDPAAPFVGFSFEIRGTDGWSSEMRNEIRVDNVHYARPAYYVSPDGKDSHDGLTEKTAFATPQAGLDAAQAGDIVVLMAGTYDGGMRSTASFLRPGKPDGWIVLKNYPGHKPVLTGNGWNIVNIRAGSKEKPDTETTLAYLEIRGLHVRGESDRVKEKYPETIGKSDSRSNSNGIAADGRYMKNIIHHLRVADCIVEYCPGQGIGALESDWVTFENNVSRYNCWHTIYGTSGFSTLGASNFDASDNVYKILLRNNVSHRNETFQEWAQVKKISDGNGIIIDVNQKTSDRPNASYLGRTLVVNNLSYDNGGSGIHTVRANRVDIVNNTAYLNSASKALQYSQIYAYTSDDVRIMNNILVAPVADVAKGEKPEPVNKLNGKNTRVVFSNNVYFGGNIPPTMGEGDVVGDPLFVSASIDEAKADFRLKAGSPAIGAGTWTAIVPVLDLAGKMRALDKAPDAGAYQK